MADRERTESALRLTRSVGPLFAAQPMEVQGATLAQLVAIWLLVATESPQTRLELLEMHADAVRELLDHATEKSTSAH